MGIPTQLNSDQPTTTSSMSPQLRPPSCFISRVLSSITKISSHTSFKMAQTPSNQILIMADLALACFALLSSNGIQKAEEAGG